MPVLYMQSYDVEPNFHTKEKGYRFAADFKIQLGGVGFATIVLSVLWNRDLKLIPGTTKTESIITDAAVSVSKEGFGWVGLSEIPGEEPWVSFANNIIRFRKRFTVEIPLISSTMPFLKKTYAELAKDTAATYTRRIEAEGYINILNKIEDLQVQVY